MDLTRSDQRLTSWLRKISYKNKLCLNEDLKCLSVWYPGKAGINIICHSLLNKSIGSLITYMNSLSRTAITVSKIMFRWKRDYPESFDNTFRNPETISILVVFLISRNTIIIVMVIYMIMLKKNCMQWTVNIIWIA